MSRARRKTVLRAIAVPFVVAPPRGARIRTRLRPAGQDAAVLGQVGDHLGRLYRADLAARVRLGDVTGKDNDRTARKRGITAGSTSRWAGTITRTTDDQYHLAMRGLRADVDTLGRALRTLDARIAAPVAGHAGRVKGYPTRAERARKQHRRAVLAGRLDAAARRLAAGTPAVVAGGRGLARLRQNLPDADLTVEQWRQSWDAARRFLTADGETGAPGGNYTITVTTDGIVSLALPAPLRHLANAPRGRYQLAAPVTFTHRSGQWADRVAVNQSVRYDITYHPDRRRWYIDASWAIPTTHADLTSLAGSRLLGVDLNADHLAAHVIDGHGNPAGPPVTVPLDLTGPTSQRDGRLRHAITTLIRVAHTTGCAGIAVENLDFVDARTTGRETMGRGRRGKRFRRTVAGIPTAKFRDRLTAMTHTAGLPVIAVDAAYTSRWGVQHWRAVLRTKTSTASGHHAAAVVIARRAHGYKARRRSGVTRTRPEDRVGKTTDQAMPSPVGVGEPSALIETARTTAVDKTRPASPRPRSSPAPKTVRGAPDTRRTQHVGQQQPTH